jgi:ATP-binding cassette subfamily C (CFTR/MRP) protein 1
MSIALIAIGSNYMAATIPLTIFVLYWIQRFYLRTSRQIRLLDLESKSPLYKHFTETIEGVSTIRAFGWQSTFDKIALRHLDYSQRPYYLLFCIQRWLNLVLDLLIAVLAVTLIALALRVPGQSDPGSLGVALTSVLAFNASIQGLITTWTEAETSIGSVARTKSFDEETPAEINAEDAMDPGPDWPRGVVEVCDLMVVYGSVFHPFKLTLSWPTLNDFSETNALEDISFAIKQGQKFAIVGRTGSGKSTLLTTLMRLIDPTSGTITIDGLDITKIPRNTVRDRLICLPQDALVFPGTFRFNLVPDSRILESSIITSALKRVNLLTLVEQRGGIDTEVTPDSLSHGEQQLLALARAILRKDLANGKCILVLDEATSNLDAATEGVVKKVIDEEFRDNTIIVVAHRLDTVKDVDVVLMLEAGRVVKLGAPDEVL